MGFLEIILVEGSIPEQQKRPSEAPFPFVFFPAGASDCDHLVEGIGKQKLEIEDALLNSGAVLFRGFKVMSPSDFNDVLEALGYDNFVYNGRGAHKKEIFGRVVTANEKPLHFSIGFHNEMAYQLKTPSKVFFYCNIEPPKNGGGASPIVQGHLVYQRLQKEMPDFLEKVNSKGLIYIKRLCGDPSRKDSWQSVFQASDKQEAEKIAEAGNTRIEWNDDGSATTFLGPRVGSKFDKARGRKVWFNSIGSTYELMLNSSPGENGVTFGDGSELSEDLLVACKKIMEEEQVAFKWQKGDVLMIDNDAVLHAREPSKPPRRILAALCAN